MHSRLQPRTDSRTHAVCKGLTYVDGTTVDDVLRLAKEGLHELLRELCEGPWATAEPGPGTAPRAEHPNLIVSLANPALFSFRDCVVIPFFTTVELARAFKLPDEQAVELVDMPVSKAVIGKPAVSFTLNGLTMESLPSQTRAVKVLIDPVVNGADAENIECAHAIDVDLQAVIAHPTSPISVGVGSVTQLFVWRGVNAREWTIPLADEPDADPS